MINTSPHLGSRKRRRQYWLAFIPAILYVLLWAMIAAGWSSKKAWAVSRAVPVPVAWVGLSPVWSHDYLAHVVSLRALETFEETERIARTPRADVRIRAINKVVRDLALARLAHLRKVRVTGPDIQQSYSAQLEQVPPEEFEKSIREMYDWPEKSFKHYVIRIDLMRTRLTETYSFDSATSQAIADQAQTVRDLIKPDGKNFSELARQYSQDDYAANGGLIENVQRGELTQELEDAAFGLSDGEVSQVIHSKYGFHILQRLRQLGSGDQISLDLRSIFLAAPSIDDAIKKYLVDHPVRIGLRKLDWDTQKVTAR